MNEHLRIVQSADGWHVIHVPTEERIVRFKTQEAAQKFYDEIAGLNWNFKNRFKVPMATWAGLGAALSRRGLQLTPDWTLEVVDAC